MKILIIEDDRKIVEAISFAFQVGWPEAKLISASRGEEGVEMVELEVPDTVILDLGLPDIDGFEVIKLVRLFSQVPIIVLTVRTDETDVVRALELGANEYVYKPFRQMELLARIKCMVRERSRYGEEAPLVWGDFRFDHARRKLRCGEEEIHLTCTESLLLYQLMKEAPRVVTYATLAEAISGENYPDAARAIKVHIRHLREKVEKDPSHPETILTRAGVGYYMVKPG